MARSVLKKLVWKWGQSHYTDLVLASRIPCLLSPNTIGNGIMAEQTGKQEPIPTLELPVTARIFICTRNPLHGNATNRFFESNGTESLSETASDLVLGLAKHGKIFNRSILATNMNRQDIVKFDVAVICVFFCVPEHVT